MYIGTSGQCTRVPDVPAKPPRGGQQAREKEGGLGGGIGKGTGTRRAYLLRLCGGPTRSSRPSSPTRCLNALRVELILYGGEKKCGQGWRGRRYDREGR